VPGAGIHGGLSALTWCRIGAACFETVARMACALRMADLPRTENADRERSAFKVERETGFEPATSSMASWCSTN
jgi:hypothetical protein